jgi:hypothetical protein
MPKDAPKKNVTRRVKYTIASMRPYERYTRPVLKPDRASRSSWRNMEEFQQKTSE